jgi:type IV secretion system protein VirB10
MKKISLILLILLLTGCEDKSETKEPVRREPVAFPSEFRYQEKPQVVEQPKVVEAEVLAEEEQQQAENKSRNIELSKKSAQLREERKANSVALFENHKKSEEPVKYQLTDKDYSPLPQDLSTLPVDRSRTITTDMRINAVLDDDINSQITGVAIAIVDKPVFSPNNKFILLPVFTKIVCEYKGIKQHGQTRLPMTCNRAIRPDGVSVTLTDAIVADQMGRTGLTGEVDNRTFETYAGAFIMSGISALAQSGVNPNAPAWRGNAQTTFSNNIGQVTADVIQKNISLKPVIYIKAGTRLQIRPKVDIVFKEPIPIQPKKEVSHEKIGN